MKFKLCVILVILMSVLFNAPILSFASNTNVREKIFEEALLQQLHTNIVGALKNIYKTEYVIFGCTKISTIRHLTAVNNKDEERSKEVEVDAMNSGMYFEITISVCKVGAKEDDVELYFKNDTAGANYYLADYKVTTGVNVAN